MSPSVPPLELWAELEPPDELDTLQNGSSTPLEAEPAGVPDAALEAADMAGFFGEKGPLAHILEGYESRPSQVSMAQAVAQAIRQQGVGLIEAPTGTGKSLAYLVPAVLSGRTVVIATANKSLQAQLFTQDIPLLAQALEQPIHAALVKGRSNFICLYKWEREDREQQRLALFDRTDDQVAFLRTWLQETDTGDVDHLPFQLRADLRPRVVSYPDDCLHRECRFYHEGCFVVEMRRRAAQAQVIVTNHHLLLHALALGEHGQMLLPPASIYIIDEAHHLESTATGVFRVAVTHTTLDQLLSRTVYAQHLAPDRLDELRYRNDLAFLALEQQMAGPTHVVEGELEELKGLAGELERVRQEMAAANPFPEEPSPQEDEERTEARAAYAQALESLANLAARYRYLASPGDPTQVVRYVERTPEGGSRRHPRIHLQAAPLAPGQLLQEILFEPRGRTVICTSATLATDGHFEHFKARCGVTDTVVEQVLPPVFDYPKQALLYQPALPAYDWQAPDAYYRAIAQEIRRLVEISRGRALCLFTSWSGLRQVRELLVDPQQPLIWPLRAQGDAPREALLEWFRATPHSVLLATRSFWEGIDLPGEGLSLVVLDKLPFPSPTDPIHRARMEALDALHPGSSFSQYMVPLMTLALKQGFGRLIRRADDRGVVAILDERLTRKAYGRQARQNLPPARFTRALSHVHRFFREGEGRRADFALNVWAWPREPAGQEEEASEGSRTWEWSWHLLRLQDGQSDRARGTAAAQGPEEAEVVAILEGLEDLHRRIRRARRHAGGFHVEIRCRATTAARLEEGALGRSLGRRWVQGCAIWGGVELLGLDSG